MVNGAGLAMATLDIIKQNEGAPSNFPDIGGGASADKVATALRIICADPEVKVILVNIFGGITRCDEVARGILAAQNEANKKIPLVVRLAGTNAEKGLKLLADTHMQTAASLEEAARKAVQNRRKGKEMSILINKETRVLVQGITGHEGSFHTAQMIAAGTNIVAGVTPGGVANGFWMEKFRFSIP